MNCLQLVATANSMESNAIYRTSGGYPETEISGITYVKGVFCTYKTYFLMLGHI